MEIFCFYFREMSLSLHLRMGFPTLPQCVPPEGAEVRHRSFQSREEHSPIVVRHNARWNERGTKKGRKERDAVRM